MHFDRFDVAAAWNLALQHCHGGQWSREHARLCKLRRSFRPAPSEEFVEGLSDNARAIYHYACNRMVGAKVHRQTR